MLAEMFQSQPFQTITNAQFVALTRSLKAMWGQVGAVIDEVVTPVTSHYKNCYYRAITTAGSARFRFAARSRRRLARCFSARSQYLHQYPVNQQHSRQCLLSHRVLHKLRWQYQPRVHDGRVLRWNGGQWLPSCRHRGVHPVASADVATPGGRCCWATGTNR